MTISNFHMCTKGQIGFCFQFRPDELMESEEDSRPSVTVKVAILCLDDMF